VNSIRVIFPYKRYGVWAFDDAAAGLVMEPFVSGVPEMIEHWTKGIPDAENGFVLLFSATPFPSFQAELVRVREEFGGQWYRDTVTGMEGWLCPALHKYFDAAPERLYLAAGNKSQG
jgi:hypothetical protein